MRAIEREIGRRLSRHVPAAVDRPQLDEFATQAFSLVEPDWLAAFRTARRTADAAARARHDRIATQRRIVEVAEAVFPGALFRRLAAELADTGPSLTHAWESAVARQQARLNHAIFDDRPIANLRVPHGQSPGLVMAFDRHAPPGFHELPAFSLPPHPTSAGRLGAVRPVAAGLLVWAVVTLGGIRLAWERALRRPPDPRDSR